MSALLTTLIIGTLFIAGLAATYADRHDHLLEPLPLKLVCALVLALYITQQIFFP